MKKLTYILAILFFSINFLSAQKWGIKGGLSISNLTSNNGEIDNRKALLGYTIGLQRNYEVTDFFFITPEISLTQKGSKYEDDLFEVKARSLYIEAPVVAKLKLFEVFYIYAGPQLSFLIDSRVKYSSAIGNTSYEDTDEENYNRVDFGGCIGVGYIIDRIFFDVRLSKGYINFDKDRSIEGAFIEAQNLKNFNAQLTAGLMF